MEKELNEMKNNAPGSKGNDHLCKEIEELHKRISITERELKTEKALGGKEKSRIEELTKKTQKDKEKAQKLSEENSKLKSDFDKYKLNYDKILEDKNKLEGELRTFKQQLTGKLHLCNIFLLAL